MTWFSPPLLPTKGDNSNNFRFSSAAKYPSHTVTPKGAEFLYADAELVATDPPRVHLLIRIQLKAWTREVIQGHDNKSAVYILATTDLL